MRPDPGPAKESDIRRSAWRFAGPVLLGLAVAGCAGGGRLAAGVFRAPADRYTVAAPGPPWHPASLDPRHLVFRAADLGAALAVFEDCTAPEPGALPWVAAHLFFGLKDRSLQAREAVQLHGRPAVRTRLEARLEGEPVAVEAFTLRGGGCLYDLVYAAPPARFAAGRPAFEAFVVSFAPHQGPQP